MQRLRESQEQVEEQKSIICEQKSTGRSRKSRAERSRSRSERLISSPTKRLKVNFEKQEEEQKQKDEEATTFDQGRKTMPATIHNSDKPLISREILQSNNFMNELRAVMDVPIEIPKKLQLEGRRTTESKVPKVNDEDLITPEPKKLEIEGEDNILVDLSTTKVEMFEHDILETVEEAQNDKLQSSKSALNLQNELILDQR